MRDPPTFARYLAPLRRSHWVVYAKAPFGGPQRVLEYLGRYTHRVAISNARLLKMEQGQVSFPWKDYRAKLPSPQHKVMTVSTEELIRRFLQHALPPGFQRIRYYGFLANCQRAEMVALCRQLSSTRHSDLLPGPPIYAPRLPHAPAPDLGSVRSAESESSRAFCSRHPGASRFRTPHEEHPPQPATAPALPSRQRTLPLCLVVAKGFWRVPGVRCRSGYPRRRPTSPCQICRRPLPKTTPNSSTRPPQRRQWPNKTH